jgi:putative intracellular protease/amidase
VGDDPQPTGVWFEELSTPYFAFIDAGAEVDIVSIAAGKIPVEPHSLQPAGMNSLSVERFLNDKAAMAKLKGSQYRQRLQQGLCGDIFAGRPRHYV